MECRANQDLRDQEDLRENRGQWGLRETGENRGQWGLKETGENRGRWGLRERQALPDLRENRGRESAPHISMPSCKAAFRM